MTENSKFDNFLEGHLFYFLGSNQPGCQENDGINIANVGARTSVICQNEKNDANKQNGKTNPDQTNTNTANNVSKGEILNCLDFLKKIQNILELSTNSVPAKNHLNIALCLH